MNRANETLPQRTFSRRWYGRLCLCLISTALLTAAFAPVNQFYLSWIGLVPWLILLDGTRSQKSAFFWSWVAGTFFFIANMWWMVYVTSYGMVALMAILGLYWGCTGAILRGAGLLGGTPIAKIAKFENRGLRIEDSEVAPAFFNPQSSTFNLLRTLLIPAVWVAASEWFRGTWPWHGLPWLWLGSTQTPALWMCQIADITGVAGISFLIVAINAWVALWLLNRRSFNGLRVSGIVVAILFASVIGYGAYRLQTEPALLTPGPNVMVVQSDFPQSNSGAKGASQADLFHFHIDTSTEALEHEKPTDRPTDPPKDPPTDLVVWSETMMPPLNPEAARKYPDSFGYVHGSIAALAREHHVGILTGAESASEFINDEPKERRNSAFFYDRNGRQFPQRYDKIHLVPYGEFIPFKDTVPWLYKLAVHFGPPDMEAYALVPGNEQHLTVFPLKNATGTKTWRFVTPICFEDIDADICADMFRPDPGTPNLKRADFLVNITNDGWFRANENPQHLQAAIFRSIENRAATARSVNTGISGFIDPLGHAYGLVEAHTTGVSNQPLQIDPRVTIFTRIGPMFSYICAGLTILLVVVSSIRWIAKR
jgi:apolipoprotein N-acyltransferase